MNEAIRKKIEGRHVLAGLTVFFGVMLLVNVIFVYSAITTFGGIDTQDAYRRGIAYNATLDLAARQSALGWQTTLTHDATMGTLSLTIADRQDHPITGLLVTGHLFRPATDLHDRPIARFEERAGGVYEIRLDGLAPGAWIADLVAENANAASYRMRERLWLPPKS